MSEVDYDKILFPDGTPAAVQSDVPPSNEYDAILFPKDVAAEKHARDKRALEASASLASKLPNMVPKVRELADHYGLPPNLVARNMESLGRPVLDTDYLLKNSPSLAEWAKVPENMQWLTPDNHTHLANIEAGSRYIGAKFSSGLRTADFNSRLAPAIMKQGWGTPYNEIPEVREYLNTPQTIPERDRALLQMKPSDTIGDHVTRVLGETAEMAPAQVASYAGAAETSAKVGLATGALGLLFGQPEVGVEAAKLTFNPALVYEFSIGPAAQSFVEYMKQPGANQHEAYIAASLSGVLQGLVERGLGVDQLLLGPMSKTVGVKAILESPTVQSTIWKYAKNVAGATAGESLEEIVQTFVQASLDPSVARELIQKRPWQENLDAFLGKVFTPANIASAKSQAASAAYGSVLLGGGAAIPGAVSDIQQVRQSNSQRRRMSDSLKSAHDAIKGRDEILAIGEQAQAAGVDALKSAPLKEMTDATPDVYIPLEQWDTYWQGQGVTGEAVAERVAPSAYAAAKATGEDLKIPMAEYVKQIAGTAHNDFFANELRVSPDQMNAREAEAFSKTVEDAIGGDETALKTLTERLRGVGFDASTAEDYASQMAAFLATQAQRSGTTTNLLERYGLGVSREGMAPEGALQQTLSPEHKQIESDFFAQLEDFPKAVEAYNALPDSEGGKILSTDVAREMSASYNADRTLSAAVHEPASQFIKRLYAQRLAELPKGSDVLFTAGGTGAGKTTSLATSGEIARAGLVYDGNLSTLDSTERKIKDALDAGHNVKIGLVVRDPVQAFREGVIRRIRSQTARHGTGRAVPAIEHIRTHVGALDVVKQIAQDYAGSSRVTFVTIDNSGKTVEEATLHKGVGFVNKLEYNIPELIGAINEQTRQAVAAGEIDAKTAQAIGQLGPELGRQLEEERSQGGRRNQVQEGQTLAQSPFNSNWVSTRLPTAAKATEDALVDNLIVGVEAAKQDPKSFAKNVAAIGAYVNYKPGDEGRTSAQKLEQYTRQMVDNLLWLHDQMSPELRNRAKLWYDGANALTQRWTQRYNLPEQSIAATMAVLSPQRDWFQNVSLAERVLDAYTQLQDQTITPEMAADVSRVFKGTERGVFKHLIAEIESGKKFRDLTLFAKAAFVRLYDEAHNPRGFRVVNPEGTFADFSYNKDGSKTSVAWGTVNQIAKAISVIEDPSRENISNQLGEQHKVRNFYNNILAPNAGHGDVTIDTHAVAAALLRPLSGGSEEVIQNFGGKGSASSAILGLSGTYPFLADAYRRAAEKRGLLPREIQSITWEAVRALFPATYKAQSSNVAAVNKIWENYKFNKGVTLASVRQEVLQHAGGITTPEWAEGRNAAVSAGQQDSSYQSELPQGRVFGQGTTGVESGAGERTAEVSAGQRLAQRERGFIQISPTRQLRIGLLEGADLSSFIHESGHAYLEIFHDLIKPLREQADLTPTQSQMLQDADTLAAWMGISSLDEMTVEHKEQFARGYEAYAMEGKAPSVALRRAFARFRSWMLALYRTVAGLNVQLNPEVRAVFDRMLATDEEIAAARDDVAAAPAFTDAVSAGMSDREFEAYRGRVEDANRVARETLEQRLVREQMREREKWWKQRSAEVAQDVLKSLNTNPDYLARSVLRDGTQPDGTEVSPIKLDRREMKARGLARQLRGMLADQGLSPHEAASLLGFSSGDALLDFLTKPLKPLKAEVAEQTHARMLAHYGDLRNSGAIADAAKLAVENEGREQVILAELAAIAKLNRTVKPVLEARRIVQAQEQRQGLATLRAIPDINTFRRIADGRVAQMRVADLQPGQWLASARKASRAAIEALAKQDYVTAAIQKQRELLSIELYRKSTLAKERAQSNIEYLRSMQRPSVRAPIGKAGQSYLQQIDALLEKIDIAPRTIRETASRASLKEWVQNQLDAGQPVNEDLMALADSIRGSYRDLSVEELSGYTDSVRHIAHLARLKNRLMRNARQREIEAIAVDMAAQAHDTGKRRPLAIESDLPQNRSTRSWARVFASLRKMSSLARQMDGGADGGIFWEHLIRPLNEASDLESDMSEEATGRLQELLLPYQTLRQRLQARATVLTRGLYAGGLYAPTAIPEIGMSLSKAGQLSVALNWGSEINRQRLMEGYGWNEAQVQAVLKHLTEQDWKTVQGIWDLIDSYWSQIKSLTERVDGIAPEKVDAVAIETPYGRIRGGYYPIKYDSEQGSRGGEISVQEQATAAMRGASLRATTRHGFRKERVKTSLGDEYKVRLDLNVVHQHLNEVIHDLTHYEALIDVNRLLRNKTIRNSIKDYFGPETYEQFRTGVDDTARGSVPALSEIERKIDYVRTGVSIAAMGFNFFTAALQPLGLFQSMVRIGPKWVGRGISRWVGNAFTTEKTAEAIYAKSSMMRHRNRTMLREINEIYSRLEGRSQITNAYFYFIGKMQSIVDIPTWLGAYEKAFGTDPNMDEKTAVGIADQAVKDSQSSGLILDLARVQRGSAYEKLFTNFYSFFSATYNLTAEQIASTRSASDVPKLIVNMLLLWTVPAVLGAMMRDAFTGQPPDKDPWARLMKAQISYAMSGVPYLREMSGAVEGYFDYSGPAGLRVFKELSGLIQQASQGKADKASWHALNNTAGILLHYPATQLQRTVEGLVQYVQKDNQSPLILITGPPKKKAQ